ncbi:hypothetical protein [Streptomyces sp. NPDC002851]
MAATRKFMATAAACAAALAGVTGCFGEKDAFDGQSADQIADKAVAAMRGTDSLKMHSTGKQDGKPVTVDLEVAESGTCKTSMNLADMGKVESLTVDKQTYTKGDATYMKKILGEDAAKKASGRWLKQPEGQGGGAAQDCATDKMFTSSELKGVKRGDDSEVAGKKTVTLVKKDKNQTTTFHVAAEGEPYILKAETKGKDPSIADFTGFNQKFTVKAPPADEIVELEELLGS